MISATPFRRIWKITAPLFVCSAVFVVLIFPDISLALTKAECINGDITPLICCGTEEYGACVFDDFIVTIGKIIRLLIFIGVAFSAVVMSYVGFVYLTSAGNTSKIQSAKGVFWKVIWGLVIMLSAWLVVSLIENALLSDEYKDASFLERTSTAP